MQNCICFASRVHSYSEVKYFMIWSKKKMFFCGYSRICYHFMLKFQFQDFVLFHRVSFHKTLQFNIRTKVHYLP